jgi:PAS domain-containing protein
MMLSMGEPVRPADHDLDLPAFARRPAGFATGPGHVVVYGNPAFRAMFGEGAIGLPARETMLDLPAEAFALLDAVLADGRPLARWVERPDGTWRLTAVPRRDVETGEVYGIAFHLRARADLPIVNRPRRANGDDAPG